MTAVVGLTGGIASGKSTVGRFLGALGVHVVDADQIARRVVEPGTEALNEIVNAFGDDVLRPDGALDRKKLGAVVFVDPEKRRVLESITHPRIHAASFAELGALAQRGDPYGIYEAALLVESGSIRMMQSSIVVAAKPETQLRRVMERDGLTEDEAKARLASQFPLEKKIEVADYVIWNDADLETLERRTREIHQALLDRFGAPKGKST